MSCIGYVFSAGNVFCVYLPGILKERKKGKRKQSTTTTSREKDDICLFSKRVCSTLSNALAHHAYTLYQQKTNYSAHISMTL